MDQSLTARGLVFATWCLGALGCGGPSAPPKESPRAAPTAEEPVAQGTPSWCPSAEGATREEALKRADDLIGRLERASSRVNVLLREARSSRDEAAIRCRDDKLSQLNATIRSAREERAALASPDTSDERAKTAARVLASQCARVDRLSKDAERCGR